MWKTTGRHTTKYMNHIENQKLNNKKLFQKLGMSHGLSKIKQIMPNMTYQIDTLTKHAISHKSGMVIDF